MNHLSSIKKNTLILVIAAGVIVAVIAYFSADKLRTPYGNTTHSITCIVGGVAFSDVTESTGIQFDNEWSRRVSAIEIDPLSVHSRDFLHELAMQSMTGGVAVADFDLNGYSDLYFVSGDYGELYMNQGNFSFTDASDDWGVGIYEGGTGATVVDINMDGFVDLLLYGVKKPPRLLLNTGGNSFFDASDEYGLNELPNDYVTFSANFGDVDGDGDLDLFLGNYGFFLEENAGKKDFTNGQESLLLRNDNGKFIAIPPSDSGVNSSQWTLASTFIDMDKNGSLDLVLLNDYGFNELFENVNGKFRNVSDSLMADRYTNSMGVTLLDYDNNLYSDLYVADIFYDNRRGGKDKQGNILLRNNGDRTFDDVSTTSKTHVGGWAWGTDATDLDNDGKEDLISTSGFYVASLDEHFTDVLSKKMYEPRVWIYRNMGTGSFEEHSGNSCLSLERDGRGLINVDLNNDGFEEIVINQSGIQVKIFSNEGNLNHWLGIRLQANSGVSEVGAKVYVNTPDARLFKEYQSGGSYLSSEDAFLIFGLESYGGLVDVEIVWHNGDTMNLSGLAADTIHRIAYEPE